MPPARRLLQYLARYRARYLAGAACLVFATAFSLGIPWAVKSGVDSLAAAGAGAPLGIHALVIVALALGHGLARFASRFAMIGAGQWVEHDLRRDVFERLQGLRPAFYQAHRTGDLMSRASNDVSTVRMLAGFGTTMVAQTGLAFAGTILAMWLIDPWLTLWALAPFPALVVLTWRFGHVLETQAASVQDQLGVLSAKVQENLSGMGVVRAYTMEEREIATFAGQSREYLARSLALAKSQAAYWPLMGLIAGLGTVIVLWAGGKAVVEGRITLGALVALNGYLGYLAWPTIALGWTLANVRRGLAAMERIGEILDAPPDGDDGEAPARGRVIAGPTARLLADDAGSPGLSLELRDLTFAYDARGPALRGVSFRVPAGALVAVVGLTGSGKSTLGALVCRLFDPPRGSTFLDGIDVRDLPLTALRRAVAYVPQEPFLFSRSIRANLLLSDEDASEDRMVAAARAAGLSREVESLPQRWDTVVGERGLTLSGGQRQRVALGRALVGEPRVLILDDPFASIDPGMEADIMEAIRAVRRGRTTLLITHRLRAVREADWVVALDGGTVAEQGPPAELAAADGLYARLWRVQQIEDTLAQD